MLSKEDIKFLELYSDSEYQKPSVTVDAVIFRLKTIPQDNYRKLPQKKLQVLLLKRDYSPYKDKFAVPGTFIDLNFELSKSVQLCVNKKVGLKQFYFEQLYTFGEKTRDPRSRVLSVSYLLLTSEESTTTNGDWFDIDVLEGNETTMNNCLQKNITLILSNGKNKYESTFNIVQTTLNGTSTQDVRLKSSNLAFDHAKIILYALERLKNKINYTDIIYNLIPKKFTLTELKLCYETVLQTKLLDANFRRKIEGSVMPLDEYEIGKGHRKSQFFTKKNTLDLKDVIG